MKSFHFSSGSSAASARAGKEFFEVFPKRLSADCVATLGAQMSKPSPFRAVLCVREETRNLNLGGHVVNGARLSNWVLNINEVSPVAELLEEIF